MILPNSVSQSSSSTALFSSLVLSQSHPHVSIAKSISIPRSAASLARTLVDPYDSTDLSIASIFLSIVSLVSDSPTLIVVPSAMIRRYPFFEKNSPSSPSLLNVVPLEVTDCTVRGRTCPAVVPR